MRSTEVLAHNFRHHGPATTSSHPRGTVAAVDGDGRNVVLVWLFDHRGGYALLVIDAATGESREFPVPFPPGGDCPYASLLSSRNRFYTHFNGYFVEFDVNTLGYTFCHETAPRMAMGLTEDDTGVIWSSTYPHSGLASYDPESGDFRDYGHLYDQNWRQYPTTLAADDAGWIYFGIGTTRCQIIAFDREREHAAPLLAEHERSRGSASVYRDLNGSVYALPPTGTPWPGDNPDAETWYELHRGERKAVPRRERREKRYISGDAGHVHPHFPDGSTLLECCLFDRVLSVKGPDGVQSPDVSFDYTSEGAHIMGVAAAPDGSICGGTFFPRRTFSYRPETDTWIERESFGQWNTVGRQGDRFFVGGYGSGSLLEWDPSRPWVTTEKENPASNPFFHRICTPTLHRPHKLLVHPDGKTLVVAGTPGYGYTGGGLLIWNCDRGEPGPFWNITTCCRITQRQAWPLCRAGSCWAARQPVREPAESRRPSKPNSTFSIMADGNVAWREVLYSPGRRNTRTCATGTDGLRLRLSLTGCDSSSSARKGGGSSIRNTRKRPSDQRRISRGRASS